MLLWVGCDFVAVGNNNKLWEVICLLSQMEDEIEGQWKSLRRAFSKRKMHEDVLEAEAKMKMLIKLGNIKAEVSKFRLWLVTMSIIVVFSFVCNVIIICS
ncbi:hypothetical protein S245_022759 [Arachis hypogaea]